MQKYGGSELMLRLVEAFDRAVPRVLAPKPPPPAVTKSKSKGKLPPTEPEGLKKFTHITGFCYVEERPYLLILTWA